MGTKDKTDNPKKHAPRSEVYATRDVFLDYDFEKVLFRWCLKERQSYRKFYCEKKEEEVHYSNRLYNDAKLYGVEISQSEYKRGKCPGNPFFNFLNLKK